MRTNRHHRHTAPRETHAQRHHSHAFTIIELLAILVTFLTLAGMLFFPINGRPGGKHPRIKCVNNLKNIGLAYRIYATDNDDRFPWELPPPHARLYSADPTIYLLTVTNELSTPKILQCPEDIDRPTKPDPTNWTQFIRTNLSYFISPDAAEDLPESFMAGDRNITNKLGRLRPGLRGLSRFDRTVAWDGTTHKNQGNTCMSDGSVQQLSNARLREALRNTGQTNKSIKLSIP